MKKIVLTGGGTAGHVYPALAVIEKLKDYEIHFIGSNGMEKDILKKFPNITYHEISAVKLERKLTFKNFLIPFKLISSIKQSKKFLKEINPNIVFSKGGFVAVPVAISAHKLKLPIISHESDLSMGLANKIILRYCNVMCTSFEKTASKNKKYRDFPITEILKSPPPYSTGWVPDEQQSKEYCGTIFANVKGAENAEFIAISVNKIDKKRDLSLPLSLKWFVKEV